MAGQWLTADEQRAWRAYLRAGTLLRARLNRQPQADSGTSLPEHEVLVQLSEAPGGRLRPFQLGAALHWEQSRLSHPLSRRVRDARHELVWSPGTGRVGRSYATRWQGRAAGPG